MLFESILILSLIIVILVVYSEKTNTAYTGIIAGVLLIFMGIFLLTDPNGIQIKNGETIVYSGLGLFMVKNK